MKEIEHLHVDPIVADATQKEKRETVFSGQEVLKPGQKVYEYNLNEGTIGLAKFDEQAVNYQDAAYGVASVTKKLIMKEGCHYIIAINAKNATRKFKAILGMK